MLGALLVLVGLGLAIAGVRLATERPRPINLAGALLAPAGLGLALAGAARLLGPGVPSGDEAPLRIMPAGDERTAGGGGPDGEGSGGYRAPLWRGLVRARVAADFVGAAAGGPLAIDRDHESWPGITLEGLAERLARDLPRYRPDLVLLHAGTTEVLAGTAPDVVEGRLASLVDQILDRGPRLYVATLVGVRVPNAHGVPAERVAEVNRRVRRLVADRAAQGRRIQLVDLHARAARTPDELQADGIHPNARGYEQMAEVWLDALRPALRPRN